MAALIQLRLPFPPTGAQMSRIQRDVQRHLREGQVLVFVALRAGASAATVEAALALLREFAEGVRAEMIELPRSNMRRCHMVLGPESGGSATVGVRPTPNPAPVSAGARIETR